MFKTLILLLLPLCIFAQGTWEENIPKADKFDWVQTTSGEWLKGEIKGMYENELEFDSKEFNIQFIDWDDVKRLMSHSITSLNIESRGILTGRLNLYDGYAYIQIVEETVQIDKNTIISMTAGGNEESAFWTGSFSLGLSISKGNTEQQDLSSSLSIKRQTAKIRFQVNHLANFSRTYGIETENNERLNASIDSFQTRRFFIRPAFVEYFADSFQNVKSKLTFGLGAGYDIYTGPRTNWTLFAGPAYQSTSFEEVAQGLPKEEETFAFILTSDYDIELNSRVDFIVKYQAYFVNPASGSYVQHTISTLRTELIKDFDLDITFLWDRVQNPKQDATGNFPQRDDYKTTLGIAYNF